MEYNAADPQFPGRPNSLWRKKLRNGGIFLLALLFGYTHYLYASTLFENDRNFSHLSKLEREMSLETEMGFYYSYYKTIVEEKPFLAGISKLMYDRLVEYPKDVNAFNRFNIHPEVLIGSLYRYLEPVLNGTRVCHMVDRGEDLSPVQSCVGVGEPILFYLEAVWALAGVMLAAVFLHAVSLSQSILGGFLAVLQYFANHAESTRVQWAPNERENFAAPLLFLQMWLLTVQLRNKDRNTAWRVQISIFVLNCLCLLFWQFTQFIFFTQVAIFFLMEQLAIIDLKTLCFFLHSHFCGLHMAVLLLHGNEMLKSSLYVSLFLIVSAYCMFFSGFRITVRNKVDFMFEAWLVLLRIGIVTFTTLYLKGVIGDYLKVEDDNHIYELLYAKFTDYKTFHTLLYTCSEVFDFLPFSSVKNLFKTLLIPFVLLVCVNVLAYTLNRGIQETRFYYTMLVRNEELRYRQLSIDMQDEDDSGIENNPEHRDTETGEAKVIEQDMDDIIDNYWICLLSNLRIDAAVFYNVTQMAVFGVWAVLFMRLKLLFVTQMCVVSSIIMDSKYYARKTRLIPFFWVICGSVMVQRWYDNMTKELSHIGEYTNIAQEELLNFIMSAPVGAFAGSMPVLASVMLSTRRPIVAHPHYEHLNARDRAYAIYKLYGRFPPEDLYHALTALKATYLIVEKKYCYGRSSRGCTLAEIWDADTPTCAGQPLLCHRLFTEPIEHFYRVFLNEEYAVFRVHDLSVRYMPRCFDT